MATQSLPRGTQSEYWRPQRTTEFRSESCEECGNELVAGSRFCHLCGHDKASRQLQTSYSGLFDWRMLRERTGLGNFSLALAIAGVAFAIAALLTGVVDSVHSFADWEGLQLARIEWLLASLAAFAGARLFKKS